MTMLRAVKDLRAVVSSEAHSDLAPLFAEQDLSLDGALTTRDPSYEAAWDASLARAPPVPVDPSTPLRVLDTWYLDDSFVRASVLDGDLWLAALDAVGTTTGLQRSVTKSFFRSPSPDSLVPPYTSLSCAVQPWASPVKFLGVSLSDPCTQFAAKCNDVAALHKALRAVDDPAVELILIRECLEVNRVTHLLRAIGPALSPPPDPPDPPDPALAIRTTCLDEFDSVMREAVASVCRCPVAAEAAQQASWGVKAGGLGLRPASVVALPAHVASLVEAQPFVEWLCARSDEAGVPCSSASVSHSSRRAAAVSSLLGSEPTSPLPSSLSAAIEKAEGRATSLAHSILVRAPRASPAPPPPSAYTLGSPPALIPDVGEGDPENKRARKSAGPRLQHALLDQIDKHRVTAIVESLAPSRAPVYSVTADLLTSPATTRSTRGCGRSTLRMATSLRRTLSSPRCG